MKKNILPNLFNSKHYDSEKFDKYYTTEKNIKKPSVEAVELLTHKADEANKEFKEFEKIAAIMHAAFGSEPFIKKYCTDKQS